MEWNKEKKIWSKRKCTLHNIVWPKNCCARKIVGFLLREIIKFEEISLGDFHPYLHFHRNNEFTWISGFKLWFFPRDPLHMVQKKWEKVPKIHDQQLNFWICLAKLQLLVMASHYEIKCRWYVTKMLLNPWMCMHEWVEWMNEWVYVLLLCHGNHFNWPKIS